MGSNEVEEPHYNFDSDGEPPHDEVGDQLTIIKKRQVVKEILQVGESGTGKPGKPYVVTISVEGFFAKPRQYDQIIIHKPTQKKKEEEG